MSIKIGRFCLRRLVLRFFFARAAPRNAADGPARPGKSTLPLGLALRLVVIAYLLLYNFKFIWRK